MASPGGSRRGSGTPSKQQQDALQKSLDQERASVVELQQQITQLKSENRKLSTKLTTVLGTLKDAQDDPVSGERKDDGTYYNTSFITWRKGSS